MWGEMETFGGKIQSAELVWTVKIERYRET